MYGILRRYRVIAVGLCLLCAGVWSANLYTAAVHCTAMRGDGYAATDEDAAAFLRGYGWEAEVPAVESVTFNLPKRFDAVYRQYNRLQNDIGLELAPYAGKRVLRRTYALKDRTPSGEALYANLLLYKNRVIAGDVMSVGLDGMMDSLAGKKLR